MLYYTGEIAPYKIETRDARRMFIDEFSSEEQMMVTNFFEQNKIIILADILKGRGQFSAEWMLVVSRNNNVVQSIIKPINEVLNFYSRGDIRITKQGNIKIGSIGIQRKGGDGGRNTANMLQFKMNPMELFEMQL